MRRVLFIVFFLLVTVGVVWYAASSVEIPQFTFEQAAGVGDSKKKVIVTGKVAEKDVTPEGSAITFYMLDSRGQESKVFYDGQDPVTAEQITAARQAGKNVSVAGHTCGDRFHTSGITIH